MANKKIEKTHRFAPKLHVKKGDRVMVISGDDKGKSGEVLEVFPKEGRAIVEDVNVVKKHRKPVQGNPGSIEEMPAPIRVSKLMVLDPKTGEPTRIGRKLENDKLVRYSKKSGEIIR